MYEKILCLIYAGIPLNFDCQMFVVRKKFYTSEIRFDFILLILECRAAKQFS